MKLRIIIISLFILILPSCSMTEGRPKTPKAENGVLNLKHWDFESDGIVNLDGKWEFYWEQLLEPEDFNKETVNTETFFTMPSIWNGKYYKEKKLTGNGYATYRLTILINKPELCYGLKIQEMATAYRLWANGELISDNGIVGKTHNTMKPQFLPGIVLFHPHSKSITLILQVSNFRDHEGGTWHSIKLGSEKQILAERDKDVAFDIFLFGILLIMGMYHLSLYLMRKKDRTALFFGILCILIALRTIFMGERLLIFNFPNLNWELAVTLEYLTMYIGLPIFAMFIHSLYDKDFSKIVLKSLQFIGIILGIIIIITPVRSNNLIFTLYQLIILLASLYVFFVLIIAAYKRRDGAIFIFIGFLAFDISIVNDILYDHGMVNTGYYVPFGLFIFILAQAIVISLRFSRSFSKIETLTGELKLSNIKLEEYSLTLEKRVEERTAIISRQKEQLEEEILLAQEIQHALLPGKVPDINGATMAYKYKPMMGVGGDFIDFLVQSENKLGLFICDVSGHGVAGAFLASMVKMSLNQWEKYIDQPSRLLTEIYSSLKDKMGGHFVSAFACCLDMKKGEIITASAGHPPMILARSNSEIEFIKPSGRIIIDFFNPRLSELTIDLKIGDKIVLYTDGITEARNDEREMFGNDRLTGLIREYRDHQPEKICNTIYNELIAFAGSDDSFEDDITLMVLEYKGQA